MKLKTALQTLITLFFCLCIPCLVWADNFENVVTATINVDIHSNVEISPSTLELLQDGVLEVKLVDSNGNPKVGRVLEAYVALGDGSKIAMNALPQTDSNGISIAVMYGSAVGQYKVCVKDITDPTNVISIENCKMVSVVDTPAPNLNTEPDYTLGDSNTITWSTTGSLPYEYLIECSTDSGFLDIVKSTSWITEKSYTFTNLLPGQIYFYRVKARNKKGNESAWSNVVYSVQKSIPPEISAPQIILQNVSSVDGVYVDTWNPDSSVSLTYLINDSTGVKNSSLFYISADGVLSPLKATLSKVGNSWVYTVLLSDLPKDGEGNLFEKYKISLEVVNNAGKKSTNIDAVIAFSKRKVEEEVPDDVTIDEESPKDDTASHKEQKTERGFVTTLVDTVSKILDQIGVEDVKEVVVVTAVTNVVVGAGLLFNFITSLPAQIFQLFMSFLTLIGIRRKGLITGYIYDSQTKDPIGRAVVRVYNKVGNLIWTDVSNGYGYFRTIDVENGEYRIDVRVNGYIFPSRAVFGNSDFPLEHIYHGGFFHVTDGSIPNFSIPIDKSNLSELSIRKENLKLVLKILLQIVYILLVVLGLLLTLYAIYISPIWFNYLILLLYLPSLYTILYLFIIHRERYGFVKESNGEKLSGITVGLYDSEFNRLNATRVTDIRGRYRFIVSPGSYYISIITPEYTVINREGLDNIEIKGKAKIVCPNITVVKSSDTK